MSRVHSLLLAACVFVSFVAYEYNWCELPAEIYYDFWIHGQYACEIVVFEA